MSADVSGAGRGGRQRDVVSMVAAAVGGLGSLGFTVYAGLRLGAPRLLLVLFGGWVVFPFVVLAVAYLAARRRSIATRLALHRSLVLIALGSLVVYGMAALGATRPGTPVFVLVAPASLLLAGLLVPMAVLFGRKPS